MKHSIVITNYDRYDLVDQAIQTFIKFHEGMDYEIIVSDDGSPEDSFNKLMDLINQYTIPITVFRSEINNGYAEAANQGMQLAGGEYITLVNSDIVFTQDILTPLEKAYESDPLIGVQGAKLYFRNGQVQHGGVNVDNEWRFAHQTGPLASTSRFCILVTGALFSIRRSLYAIIGGLSSDYPMTYDDADYCLRAWQNGFRVFYNADVEAIHLEGITRGSCRLSKMKNPIAVERESISKVNFEKTYGHLSPAFFVNLIKNVEKEYLMKHLKIEIGGGEYGEPGYVQVDARAISETDIVCDIENQALPLENESVEEILTNHCIEHVSWRKIPFVISEWSRVLKTDGFVTIRTPDLTFIINHYLSNSLTPEWPEDENTIKRLYGEVDKFWWITMKLFAGQSFKENAHKVCFTFDALKKALLRYGFSKVELIKLPVERSPGELQIRAWKGKTRPKLLLKRDGALGDVIMTTPFVKELSKQYDVTVQTQCPAVYEKSPYASLYTSDAKFDRVIDLNMVYERDRTKSIWSSYCDATGVTPPSSQPELTITSDNTKKIESFLQSLGNPKYVVLHPCFSWPAKTFPVELWEAIADHIKLLGYTVLAIGNGQDHKLNNAINCHSHHFSIQEIKVLIDNSALFVGADSGPYHIAAMGDVPQIGIFTNTNPAMIAPTHKSNIYNVESTSECRGCVNASKSVFTYLPCANLNGLECVKRIPYQALVYLISKILGATK